MRPSDFMKYRNWVVIGDVPNNLKYANKILKSLDESGYNVVGVNPRGNNEEVITSLKQVNYDIDVIDLCINPIEGLKVVKEAKNLNINKILIQPGAESSEILEYCKNNDIIGIEGCALVELSKIGV